MSVGGRDGRSLGENVVGAAQILWALATPFLRSRRTHWGATDEEARRVFPGDALVPNPRWQFLHAVTVEVPPEVVWPWIAQIGQGRGGFYSYQLLENLVGCGIENANVIQGQWQQVAVGDAIKLHAKAPPLKVAVVEPGHALVLHGNALAGDAPPTGSGPDVNVSWAFVVERLDASRSRLFSRDRADHAPGLLNELGYGPWLVEPISFVMDRKMLRGIKWRAESGRRRAT